MLNPLVFLKLVSLGGAELCGVIMDPKFLEFIVG